jgi:hypothetical protein
MKLSSQKFFGTRDPHSFPYMSVELPSPSGRGQAMIYLKARRMKGGMEINSDSVLGETPSTNGPMDFDAIISEQKDKVLT